MIHLANTDDGSCIYPGCTDPDYLEYDEVQMKMMVHVLTIEVEGCTDKQLLT